MGGGRSPLKWAVIGTGRISDSVAPDIRSVPGNVLSVVWGRRPEAAKSFAERHGVGSHTTDLDAALSRDDVDVVYVATPIATHRGIALRALELGKHVLVEKPIASSEADAAEIFARARAADRFVMEAMWMKFNPLHREVMSLIADGLIGRPRYVRAGFGMPFPPGGSRWSAELGGSTVRDQGIYPVTLAEWVLGPARAVAATGEMREGVDVAAQITLDHGEGRSSHLACSVLEFVDPSASVSGTGGWIEIPAMFWATGEARIHAGSTRALFEAPDALTRAREGNGYGPMIRSVAEAMGDGRREHAWHDASATLATARTLDAVRSLILETLPEGHTYAH